MPTAGCCPGRSPARKFTELLHQRHGAQEGRQHQVGRRDRQGDRQALAGRLHRPEGHEGLHGPSPTPTPAGRTGRSTTAAGRPGPPVASASAVGRRARRRPYFLVRRLLPVRATWGARSPRRRSARSAAGAEPEPARDPFPTGSCRPPPNRPGSRASAARSSSPDGRQAPTVGGRRGLRHRRTIVAPSPPSPRSPDGGRERAGSRRRRPDRIPKRPCPEAVDDRDLVEPGKRRVVEVALEELERLVDPGAPQVERRRHRPSAGEADRSPTGSRPRDRSGPSRPRDPRAPASASPTSASARSARSPPASRRWARGSGPLIGSRSAGSAVIRRPPASSVTRLPPRSSAATRPSQPWLRLRARSPSRQMTGPAGGAASTSAVAASAGRPASSASASSTAASSERAVTVSRSSA